MSKINGEKARAAIQRRRRTAQREKDRAQRAEMRPVPQPDATQPATTRTESESEK